MAKDQQPIILHLPIIYFTLRDTPEGAVRAIVSWGPNSLEPAARRKLGSASSWGHEFPAEFPRVLRANVCWGGLATWIGAVHPGRILTHKKKRLFLARPSLPVAAESEGNKILKGWTHPNPQPTRKRPPSRLHPS